MGILFQPAPTLIGSDNRAGASVVVEGHDRASVVLAALEALVLGDSSRLEDIFSTDLTFRSPHVSVRSRSDLLQAVGEPESTLGEVEIALSNVVIEGSTLAAEWRVDAVLVGPVLFGDNVLVEATGDRVQLLGAAFAEFGDDRIRSFRTYFDDSELLDGVPGVTQPLRWTARWSGSPGPRRGSVE